MDAGLAAPPLAMGSESPEQRLGVLHVARDVVIPQDDHLAGERAVLFCDSIHASQTELHLYDRAGETGPSATSGHVPKSGVQWNGTCGYAAPRQSRARIA